ncbi:hypothetical protein ACFQMF_02650 [Halorubrum rutilum]|uniref:DUF7993 domain-containing protein n=1 Tax=Halorubrum rutilum TaxID=1364933 RepID=A0ABD6AHY5_9EURY|nr:hypothetical protein [Halorubrum rutilum]
MVEDRLTDGVRIGQLLASEISGNEGRLRDLALADADPDAEPTLDGALAYRIVRGGEGTDAGVDAPDAPLVAEVYVQPDRARIEFVGDDGGDTEADLPKAAADAADEAGLRVRPKAVRPPRTLVFVEDGAEVKRALPAFEAVVDAVRKG